MGEAILFGKLLAFPACWSSRKAPQTAPKSRTDPTLTVSPQRFPVTQPVPGFPNPSTFSRPFPPPKSPKTRPQNFPTQLLRSPPRRQWRPPPPTSSPPSRPRRPMPASVPGSRPTSSPSPPTCPPQTLTPSRRRRGRRSRTSSRRPTRLPSDPSRSDSSRLSPARSSSSRRSSARVLARATRVVGAPTISSRSTASSWIPSRPYHLASRGSPTPYYFSGAASCAASSRAATLLAPMRRRPLPSTRSAPRSLHPPRAPSHDEVLQTLLPSSFRTLEALGMLARTLKSPSSRSSSQFALLIVPARAT